MNGVKTALCPMEHYEKYRSDLEKNGYVILTSEKGDQDGDPIMIFTYQKIAKTVFELFKEHEGN